DDADRRELVVGRAMALDQDELDLDVLKSVVLLVLFIQPGAEEAYTWIEPQMYVDDQDTLHCYTPRAPDRSALRRKRPQWPVPAAAATHVSTPAAAPPRRPSCLGGQMHDAQHTEDIVHAGFWRRWIALIIDQLILGVGFYATAFAV